MKQDKWDAIESRPYKFKRLFKQSGVSTSGY
jgi:hypothetical protein